MNKSIIARMVENCEAENMSVQFLQCGSSINNPFARDIDIMVYTCNNLYNYFIRFQEQFKNEHIIKKNYIKIWNMYTLKIKVNKEIISFHIVSFEDLRDYVSRVDELEIYTDINLFALSMKLPTVYRKWIIETNHICGNDNLKKQLELMLKQYKIPVEKIKKLLEGRIINSINYYFEKKDSTLFSGIIISQIFNDLVLYCYAANNTFFGTLKYVESDLKSFKNCVELSEQSMELFHSINKENMNNIIKRLNEIQKLL